MRIAALTAVLVTVAGALGGACDLDRSGYQFVRSAKTGTYLKVPSDWTVFGAREIDDYVTKQSGDTDPNAPTPGTAFKFISTFDAGAHPSVGFDAAADHPGGVVRVRALSPEERDAASFATIRDEIVHFQDGLDNGQISVRSERDISTGAVRGQRVVFDLTDPTTNVVSTFDQTTLLDHKTSTVYLLVVGCRQDCFNRNKRQIAAVATSFTIKER